MEKPKNSVAPTPTAQGVGSYKVLYLFSGPLRPDDGLGKFLHELGIECVYVDLEVNASYDLLDQDVWERISEGLPMYDGYMMSPPCCAFSMARRGNSGPQPLRAAEGKEIYGLRTLKPEDKKRVQEGNVLALRAHSTASQATQCRKPWILEQPHEREGKPSMFKLEEYRELEKEQGVQRATFDQCRFGCEFEKKTDLLANFELGPEFHQLCNHPPKWWRVPWSGEWVWASHPPLRGKQVAVEAHMWNPGMLRTMEPQGDYITRRAAAYPADLNRALARALAGAVKAAARTEVPKSIAKPKFNVDPKPVRALQFGKSQNVETQVDDRHSLRNVRNWVNDKMRFIGVQAKNIIEDSLSQNADVENCIWENISQHQRPEDVRIPEPWLDHVRSRIIDLFFRNDSSIDVRQLAEPQTGIYETKIRGRLLHAWSCIVGDPGANAAKWIFEGAPAGLEMDSKDLDGMFPKVEDDELGMDEINLDTDFGSFSNYTGVEEDSEAFEALESYYEKGFMLKFRSLGDVERHLGCKPTLSKLGCIKKMKYNPDTDQYTYKARIILDCKRSGVSKRAQRTHKSMLPRATDAVLSVLHLMAQKRPGQEIQLFIADIVDAFWLVPLHVSERRYFCAYLRGHYYLFTRTAQVSRMAPLTFAAIMSVASRWIQSLSDEYAMQVYVDDPLVAILAEPQRIKRLACVIASAWMIMGFPLAFHKATLAPQLVWIGVQLEVKVDSVVAEIPESKVSELIKLLRDTLRSNLVSIKSLRSLTGKLTSVASVIQVWRPFVQQLYKAMHVQDTRAPKGCVWVKQIQHTIAWLLTLGPVVVITWDASPYGMGGTLQISGTFVSFFAIPITKEDQDILQTEAGDCRGQQVWEALAGLVALRAWSPHWQHFPVVLQVRNDNVGALTLFSTLKGGSPALSLIAREFALDLGKATCRPALVQHLPGITNKTCDALSRRYDPHFTFELPRCLLHAKPILPPARDKAWWRSLQLTAPSSSSAAPLADSKGIRSRSPRRK
eukprot:s4006_g5.t1